MRRSKEIVVLLVLLVGTMAFILWYVAQRKARNKAEAARPIPAAAPAVVTPTPTTAKGPEPVALGGANEQKTIDFSSGQAVVKDSPEDKAAMDAALKDMAAAVDNVSFGPAPKKKTEPASTPPKS